MGKHKPILKKCLDCPAQITAGKRCAPCGAARFSVISKASKQRLAAKRRATKLIGPAIAAAE